MVVNEKALIREMKEAYKGYGYTVAVDHDDTWTVSNGYWLAQIDGQHNVPNEILSLVVLHMGMLPTAGTAYRVYKTKDGPEVQNELLSVALEHIKNLMQNGKRLRIDQCISVPPACVWATIGFGSKQRTCRS